MTRAPTAQVTSTAMPLTPAWFDASRLMSVDAATYRTWLRAKSVPAKVRALLHAIGQRGGTDCVAWPSLADLAGDIGWSVRYTCTVLRQAEELGCLKVVHGHNLAGRRAASVYVLRAAIPDDLAAEWGMPDVPVRGA